MDAIAHSQWQQVEDLLRDLKATPVFSRPGSYKVSLPDCSHPGTATIRPEDNRILLYDHLCGPRKFPYGVKQWKLEVRGEVFKEHGFPLWYAKPTKAEQVRLAILKLLGEEGFYASSELKSTVLANTDASERTYKGELARLSKEGALSFIQRKDEATQRFRPGWVSLEKPGELLNQDRERQLLEVA